MALKLVRFNELGIKGDWIFLGKNLNVLVSTWSDEKGRVLEARSEGASLDIGMSAEYGYTMKFTKGARINLDGNILAFEPSSGEIVT